MTGVKFTSGELTIEAAITGNCTFDILTGQWFDDRSVTLTRITAPYLDSIHAIPADWLEDDVREELEKEAIKHAEEQAKE